MNYNKKAFSFVELIITISILILLAVIATTALNTNNQKVNNTKVEADIITLKNAFTSYNQENKTLPLPNGNNNYFAGDSTYAHSGSTNAFGVYGSVTEATLPKKYIDNIPLDPVSNHYYSYGKTLNNKYFEVASIIRDNEISQTKLDGNYPGEYGPISLIREYNGGFFISDKSIKHLPYNPDEHILTATDQNGKIYHIGDTITTTTSPLNLYFSDGSVSTLETNSSIILSEMDFKTPENNLTTKIKLFLSAGTIFTKATALDNNSDFEIYTSDTTAAVRGTIFSVSVNAGSTEILVFEGEVEVYKSNNNPERGLIIEEGQTGVEVTKGKKTSINVGTNNDTIEILEITEPEAEIQTLDTIQYIIPENLPKGKLLEAVLNGEPEQVTNEGAEVNNCEDNYSQFKMNGNVFCEEKVDGKELYAYAPYDEVDKTLDIFSKGYIKITQDYVSDGYSSNKNGDNLSHFGNEINKDNSLVKKGLEKGIVLTTIDGKYDFLKYSNLDLGNNFAIEISVLGKDLKNEREGNYQKQTHYLLDSDKFYLDIYANELILGYEYANEIILGYEYEKTYTPIKKIEREVLLELNNDIFYKVIVTFNGKEWNLKVGDIEGKNAINNDNNKGNDNELDDLYVGSDKDKDNQWNGIINYIKIYK